MSGSSAPAVGPVFPSSSTGPGSSDSSVGAGFDWRGVALDHDPAQAGRLEVRPERVGVADEHDRGVVHVQVVAGRRGDRVDVDRLDVGAIADQLLHAEAVDGEAAQRPDDRPRGLEPEREDADQEVARGDELGLTRPACRASARARRACPRWPGP